MNEPNPSVGEVGISTAADAAAAAGPAPGAALSPGTRRALRARAHALRPVVMIGSAALTGPVHAEIERALAAHELVKIRVLGAERDGRDALLEAICQASGAHPVQHLGKMLVIFRERPPAEEKPVPAPARRAKRSVRR
jgi:RNA-binding protein